MRGIGARALSASQVSDWVGSTNPVSIPSRGRIVVPPPRVWITAASAAGGVSNGATLTDLSPNGHDATITNGTLSVRSAATPTGVDALYRSATSNYATFGPGTFTGLTAVHLFAYLRSNSSSGQRSRGPWWLSYNNTNADQYAYSDESIYHGAFASTRPSFAPTLAVRNAWRVVEIIADGTNNTYKLDGATQYTFAASLVLPTTGYLFDSYPWGSTIAGVQDIADFRVYEQELTATQAESVRNEMAAIYGATG